MRLLIHDGFNPEDNAMLQALYSRSAKSVTKHLSKVRETGSGKFMERFYIGYGHSSIGDCGSTTIFIEGVSELAAKAIQDWPLYSGQQTSTRYIDFANQPIYDPLGTPESKAILDRWMDFYCGRIGAVRARLASEHPWDPSQGDEASWERALKARSFDIMRSFLPAGITTQLSWHTNLRQAADKLDLLIHHPLPEVRELAEELSGKLAEHYRHSFSRKRYPEQEAWREKLVGDTSYLDLDWSSLPTRPGQIFQEEEGEGKPFFYSWSDFKPDELKLWNEFLTTRPQKTNLPLALDNAGRILVRFVLDYGSFRDLQRHRQGVIRMPLLTARHGFEPWYLEMLPNGIRAAAEDLIASQTASVQALGLAPELAQYYLAFGYRVVVEAGWGLPSAVYLSELRSGSSVHPSLRRIAWSLGAALRNAIPGLALHLDHSPDHFSLKRGREDISERPREV